MQHSLKGSHRADIIPAAQHAAVARSIIFWTLGNFDFQRTSRCLLFVDSTGEGCTDDVEAPTPSPFVQQPTTGYNILTISVQLSESNCNFLYFCHRRGRVARWYDINIFWIFIFNLECYSPSALWKQTLPNELSMRYGQFFRLVFASNYDSLHFCLAPPNSEADSPVVESPTSPSVLQPNSGWMSS